MLSDCDELSPSCLVVYDDCKCSRSCVTFKCTTDVAEFGLTADACCMQPASEANEIEGAEPAQHLDQHADAFAGPGGADGRPKLRRTVRLGIVIALHVSLMRSAGVANRYLGSTNWCH